MAQNFGNLFINGESAIEDMNGTHTGGMVNGGVTISTTEKKYGTGSISALDYVYLKVDGSHADLNFELENYTVDFWIKWSGFVTIGDVMTKGAAGTANNFRLQQTGGNSLELISNQSVILTTGTLNDGEWHHVAIVREGVGVSETKIYLDGIQNDIGTDTTNYSTTGNNLYLFSNWVDGSGPAFFDNFRLTKGTALWTDDFNTADHELFYTAPANPNRPDNMSELFNSKQTSMRGQANAGFYRPTIAEFFTSKDFIQEKKTITAKSVVLDFANNWGKVSYMGIRSVEFKLGGSVLPITTGTFTDYFSTEYNAAFSTDHAFNIWFAIDGSWSGNSWMSGLNIRFNQRIIVVFNDDVEFDEIVVNNTHTSGTQTDTGVKDTKIYSSTDVITNTVFNSIVPNSKLLFDGQIPMHSAVNGRDDFVVYHN